MTTWRWPETSSAAEPAAPAPPARGDGLFPSASGADTLYAMRPLTPEEVRQAVRGRWRWPAERVLVEGISTDTRKASRGHLFVALRGERFDGHDFLTEAAGAGCVAAIVAWEAPLEQKVLARFPGGVIGVPDTTVALGDVAAHCRRHLAATFVAVTGSNGKTTVKEMIHHVLSGRLRGSASPQSFNNAVGVPLTLFAAATDDQYVVCEVGSNATGEIATLARIVQPDVAVITNVSRTHLEGLVDLDRVAMEKAALLGGLRPNGMAVISADSEPLARAVRGYDVRLLIRFGEDDAAELRLTACQARPDGVRFQINDRLWAELPVPGTHNALNALAAIAVAQRFGFAREEAVEALGGFRGGAMRLESIRAGRVTILNDTYNANPASLAAAAEVLASHDAPRRVAVVGDMLELGPAGAELHREAGENLARRDIELVVGVGELGGRLADGAEAGGTAVRRIGDVERAMRELPGLLRDGDVVLIKGSRALAMERLVEPIRGRFGAAGGRQAPARAGGRRRDSGTC